MFLEIHQYHRYPWISTRNGLDMDMDMDMDMDAIFHLHGKHVN